MQNRNASKKQKKPIHAQRRAQKSPKKFGWKAIVALSFIACALAAVLIAPSPYEPTVGGITLIGHKPEVAVYGPEAPDNIIEGYSQPINTSNVIVGTDEEDSTLYVYASEGARCYHLGTCKFAFASAQRMTIMEAHFLGYEACGRCDPPTYAEYYG